MDITGKKKKLQEQVTLQATQIVELTKELETLKKGEIKVSEEDRTEILNLEQTIAEQEELLKQAKEKIAEHEKEILTNPKAKEISEEERKTITEKLKNILGGK